MLPVIIVGGVKSGIFTMTESAAVAVAYAFVVGAMHRELTFARIWEALYTTAIATSGLLFILAMASIVSFALTIEEVPTTFANSLLSISDNKLVILLMLNIILLILGKFLEPISVMIVTMPILIKVAQLIQMDMVQFGVMVTLNVVIGMVTPPVGVCLFVVCAIAGKSILEVSREVLPMFFICLALLALVATVPAITLWLPRVTISQKHVTVLMTAMSHPSEFRSDSCNGELLIGTFIKTPTSHTIEIIGELGFDFIVIDEEHALFDRVTIDARRCWRARRRHGRHRAGCRTDAGKLACRAR